MLKHISFIFFTLIVSQLSHGATRYVTDELWLQLRTGPSSEYRIIKAIKTGDRLDELSTNEESGYSKVRTKEGVEGWVLTRFLEKAPIARIRLARAEKRIKSLSDELKAAKEQRDEALSSSGSLKEVRSSLARDKQQLSDELEALKKISANAVAIHDKNKTLTKRNQEIEIRMQTLEVENAQMHSSRQKDFLLYGGGLVIAGILAGLILPSLRSRKNGSGWS